MASGTGRRKAEQVGDEPGHDMCGEIRLSDIVAVILAFYSDLPVQYSILLIPIFSVFHQYGLFAWREHKYEGDRFSVAIGNVQNKSNDVVRD